MCRPTRPPYRGSNTPLNGSEQELADQMKTYWANFVKTGDLNIGREVNPPGSRSKSSERCKIW
jgi:hypothetical protein